MKVLSLCSGVGGAELALERSDIDAEIIGYAEIDKYANSIYKKHFPNHKNLGDLTEIKAEELEDFDMLIAGIPCQAFSVAGKQKGFADTRGTIFFDVARILKVKRPKYFLIENVKNFLSHDKGNTFQVIASTLLELGYNIRWDILNSKDFCVPQNRERIYIRGVLKEYGDLPDISLIQSDIDNDICMKPLNSKVPQGMRLLDPDGLSCTQSALGGGWGAKTGLYKVSKPLKIATATKKGYDEVYPGDGVRLDHPGSVTGRGRTQSKGVGTLTCSSNWGAVDYDFRVRRLVPVEVERLQSFPDNWTQYGKDGEKISDSQRYKCMGNAFTVNVIKYILNSFHNKEVLDGRSNKKTI